MAQRRRSQSWRSSSPKLIYRPSKVSQVTTGGAPKFSTSLFGGRPGSRSGEVIASGAFPPSVDAHLLKQRFEQLAAAWKCKAQFLSSPKEMAALPEYRRIVELGQGVIPLLLDELRVSPSFWFSALRELTGEDPVDDTVRGKVDKMAEAWVLWGESKGFRRK